MKFGEKQKHIEEEYHYPQRKELVIYTDNVNHKKKTSKKKKPRNKKPRNH